MRPRCLIAAVLVAAGATAEASEGPWVALQFSRVDDAGFRIAADGRIDAVEHRLSGALPLSDTNERHTTLGLDYVYTRYEYAGLAGRNRDLHRLALPLTTDWARGDWRFSVTAAPGISASSNVFKDPAGRWTRDEVTLAAGATVRYAASGDWSWRAGLARDQRFGGPRVYPLAALLYSRPTVELELGWPETRATWRPTGRTRIVARLCAAGHRWRVVSDESGETFDYRVRAGRATLGWSFALLRSLALEVGGGYEFARHHRLTDDGGRRFAADADGAWLFTAGLRAGGHPAGNSRVSMATECR